MIIIIIRDSDHTMVSGCFWYSAMILKYCSPPLISATIFQSLALFKIDQCYDVFALNDGLSPSLMKLIILMCKLRDAVVLLQATSIIPTSCLSTLLWHHVYLTLLSAMEDPEITCSSVPGFSHNEHFPSLDSSNHGWQLVICACMTCVSYLSDMCHIFDQVNNHNVAGSHMVWSPCRDC